MPQTGQNTRSGIQGDRRIRNGGACGFPWVSARFGSRQAAEKYAERSQSGFLLAMHNTSHSAAALSRGAKFSNPSLKNSVNAIDPVLRNVIADWLNGYLAKEPWVKPLTIMVRGFDEPSNNLEEIFSFAKIRRTGKT